MTTPALVEHFFRHEYGKLVAVLSCRVGMKYVEDVEDAVQYALVAALDHWTRAGLPDNPSAWLFRIASNHLLGELRTRRRRQRILDQNATVVAETESLSVAFLDGEFGDELLQMLFACCDEEIPRKSQLVLALKTLCGFDVREIAIRLFTGEANVYKRLGRARNRLRELEDPIADLCDDRIRARLPAVLEVLYLLFNEGYLSLSEDAAIRHEMCNEAIRLMDVLVKHPIGQTPDAYALLALMHLHAARAGARQDATGGMLLLEEQDRSLWDRSRIHEGLTWLAKSAEGESMSRYHVEASIAAEHCMSPSFAATRWQTIADAYAQLQQITNSPLHKLNRAVAVAEWQGPAHGLAVLESFAPPTWLAGSYLWAAVMSDLHGRCGNRSDAIRFRDVAIKSAPTEAVRVLLRRRLHADALPLD